MTAERAAPRWESRCLDYDASGVEKVGPDEYRRVRDVIVTARKGGECFVCWQQLVPGTRIRALTDVLDGELHTRRFCNACCKAMAKSWTDGGDAIEKRYALGQRTAFERREIQQTGHLP